MINKINIKKVLFIILFVAVLVCPIKYNNINAFAHETTSEIVMETSTLRVLHEKNTSKKMYMASTTKILTCLVAIENMNMSDIITITNNEVGIEGSSIYLQAGEKLTVKDLLYGLMLRSGNDCAVAIANNCSGDVQKFADLMNITAKRIGANNSNFVNPHGLHDDNHYTTAYDLALISCFAMNNSTFREIVSTKSINIPFTTQNCKRHLVNKNKMLSEFEGSNGIKTGYTKKAGRCLVSSCFRDGMELVCVVLNCQPMFERSKELLATNFSNYHMQKLVDSNNIVGFTYNDYLDEKIGLYIKNDIIIPISDYEIKNLKILYDYPDNIDYTVKKDQEIGSIKIYCENNLLFEEKIYTIIGTE